MSIVRNQILLQISLKIGLNLRDFFFLLTPSLLDVTATLRYVCFLRPPLGDKYPKRSIFFTTVKTFSISLAFVNKEEE